MTNGNPVGMELQLRLKTSLSEAAKAKDQVKLDTIRLTLSALRYKEIEKMSPLKEDEALRVLQGLCKQRRESIDQFAKGGRQDLVDKEKRELEILESFLPSQLSEDKVRELAGQVIRELNAKGQKDMGRVMKVLLEKIAGQADGKMVSDVVRGLLVS